MNDPPRTVVTQLLTLLRQPIQNDLRPPPEKPTQTQPLFPEIKKRKA